MAIDEVGYYALPVIPSFQGMDRQVNSQMRKTFGGFGKSLGKDIGDNIGQGLKSSASAVQSAAKAHTQALDKVADATGKVRAEQAKLDAARSNAASRAQAVGTAERRLAELRDDSKATTNQLATAEKQASAARERARNAAAQVTTIEQRVASNRRAEAAATREAQAAERELADARRRTNASGGGRGGLFSGFRTSMQTEGSGLASMAGGIGGKIGGAFMGALAGVVSVAAVASIFKSALDTGIDFERTVNAFSGVTAQLGDTAETNALRMEKMRDAARALGADTQLAGVSARDAGNAMLELAKGGMTADQAMAAARGTLQLATAGQIDAAEAAKIQSAAINTFSLKATDAMHVADLLAAAANASSADVTDLGYALQQGGSVAAGFGVSIEDTLTALTMFSRMGINGSDAGTMLKTSLQAITDQGNPAQGAIEELGLKLYDANRQFVGVESMMKQVAEASKRMSQEEFQAATAVLFGSDAMRASMVAAKGGAQAWDDSAAAVRRQGAAADMAGAQMQGLPGVVEALSNSWEAFKLKLFDVIDGPLITIGNWFTNVISGEGTGPLQQYAENFKSVFASIGDSIGPAKEMLGSLGDAFRQYVMPAITEYQDKLKGPLSDLGRQVGATFRESLPILKAVGMVLGGLLVGAIKVVSVTVPIMIRAFTVGQAVAQRVFQAIKVGATILVEVAKVIGSVFVGAWNLAKTAISAAWSVISPVFDAIKGAFSALGQAAGYVFDTVLVPMWHNFELAASGAAAVLSPIWDGIKAGFSAIGDAATWLWKNAIVPTWEGVKAAMSAGWSAISPIFENLKNAFKSVSDFVSTAWSGLGNIVKAALDAVINAVKAPLRWLGGVLQRVPLSIGPVEIPGAQAAKDLGNSLAGLAAGGVAGRTPKGLLWGPGTGTSDSIIGVDTKGRPTALVSAGEGVVTAKAMNKGGAPVVAALNAGWVPSPELLHAMIPGYRTGGVVDGPDVRAAMSMAGTAYSQGNRTDCSGMVARVILKALGIENSGGLMSTKNAEQWLSKLGFRTGTGGPGAITVGWYDRGPAPNDGHMAMTLSNGQNAEAGGGNGVFTIGSDAKGGDDPSFDQHMYLPIENLYGEGSSSGGSLGGFGGGSYGSVGGGLADAGGSYGYEPASPKQLREAEDRVSDRERTVVEKQALVDERQRKLDSAKPAQRDSMQRQLDNAKDDLMRAERERDQAKDDLAETRRGKPRKGSADGKDGGDSQLGELGSIGSQFLKDTFGLGDLFPDPSQLGIVKLAQSLLGIKYTPQGKGFPWQTGYANGDGTPWSGTPASPLDDLFGGGGGGGGGGGQLPLGMIPGVSSVLPDLGMPGAQPQHQGTGAAPGPVDQSMHVTVNNPQGTPEANEQRIRRTLLNTPRYGTYTANPGVMGK
ncbi:phage tail tape measure protein [Mycolicibacterium fortuitum]|uniref:Phage tail tape measure protein n=1 Tax=Mycolicibacterium fortuitum TaxID=1766 RepID=A0AAE4VEL3_MYCFO|nr:phage tail tape measure protein [Mycolicibacterium fortuitum]MDV7192582.1 phage tail tape measure protein [Mycolicibacterium fortuitum]MDV7205483.1 phage tail tape measure protein [Mycolicibacterium fortuitum]MDV7227064.1 phage tail tape measure protein [Mycolicibacterium fortuitum]MDV7259691.1 phage tail tape measure protein [Mycolicibacterium fortuitum]MDV7286254.1 phage tail tape measure protein [Mycolicibacterium fortuitum]